MKNTIGIYFLILLISISCVAKKGTLENSMWFYNHGECKDCFEFKEQNQYKFYSCEAGDTVFGFYSLEKKILKLYQIKGFYDQEFPQESRHKTLNLKFEMDFCEDSIIFKTRWEIDTYGNWVKSDFEFPENYIFKKF